MMRAEFDLWDARKMQTEAVDRGSLVGRTVYLEVLNPSLYTDFRGCQEQGE